MRAFDYGWIIKHTVSLCAKYEDKIFPLADLEDGDKIWIEKKRDHDIKTKER